MSKAALESATVSWAQDLQGTGVSVNVLVPGGPTNTSFIPEDAPFDRGALVQPQVMAAPMRWLASDASDGVTGCRVVGRDWDLTIAPVQAAKKACSPAAWQDVKTKAAWPGPK
jgi:3-oxoacyl-[acyl-carrier protein] reductase